MRRVLAAAALVVGAGCTPPPEPEPSRPAAPVADSSACRVGGDARGVAAGFFALFQDRPECF